MKALSMLLQLVLVSLPVLGIWLGAVLHRKALNKRDERLKDQFGKDIVIRRSFPIDQRAEEVIQGCIEKTIQHFRVLLIGDGWLFVELSSAKLPAVTLFEERTASMLGVYARELRHPSPYVVVRNKKHRSLVSRHLQDKIKNHELVWCEGGFDKDHNIFVEKGWRLDVLSVLSPEVLIPMMEAPFGADIILKRNQLYYVVPGGKPAEDVLQAIDTHGRLVTEALEDNLQRWARSAEGRAKTDALKERKLAVTLREKYERDLS